MGSTFQSEAPAGHAVYRRAVSLDAAVTDPDKYKASFENDGVRVLEYKDKPGDHTDRHGHPDSVTYTLSSFRRRLVHGDRAVDVEIEAGRVGRLDAQDTTARKSAKRTHTRLFIELKEPGPQAPSGGDAPARARSEHLGATWLRRAPCLPHLIAVAPRRD